MKYMKSEVKSLHAKRPLQVYENTIRYVPRYSFHVVHFPALHAQSSMKFQHFPFCLTVLIRRMGPWQRTTTVIKSKFNSIVWLLKLCCIGVKEFSFRPWIQNLQRKEINRNITENCTWRMSSKIAPLEKPTLEAMFTSYAKYRPTSNTFQGDGKRMLLSQSDAWMQQARLIGEKRFFTLTDTGVTFFTFG